MKKKVLLIIVYLFVMVIMLSSCKASFPSKEEIAGITSEEATKRLENKTAKEIQDNWGEPDGFFSGLYGDIYTYEDKYIGVYYVFYDESNESRIERVVIWDKEQ